MISTYEEAKLKFGAICPRNGITQNDMDEVIINLNL
jgi:hypothetical protein